MKQLLDEANAYIARADIGHRDPKKLNEAHRLIIKLTDALEAAEQSAIEADALKDTVCDWKQQAEHAIKEKCRLDERLATLRALLPELKALDEAGKKATQGEWVSMGHSSVIFVDSGKTPIAKVYEQPTWTRGNAHFMCLAANARAVVAKLLREIEGEG